MLILGSPFMFGSSSKLIGAIGSLGLTSGLQLCLDAGDENSYTSGQKWLDVSGNGYDFFLGTTASSQSTDPTFHGTPGGQSSSEYWTFDGNDYFLYDSANETWMNNIHKDNAKWAFAGWVYYVDTDNVGSSLFSDQSSFSEVGAAALLVGSSPFFVRISIANGSGSTARQITSTSGFTGSAWHFVAGWLDEAANTAMLQSDANQESFSGSYTSPSASDASNTLRVGSPTAPFENGSRMNSFAMWEGTIPSSADLLALFNATKARFGL